MIIPLVPALLTGSSDLPGNVGRAVLSSTYARLRELWRDIVSLFGLAPCGVLPAICLTADAVRSYRTFSPLPRRAPCGAPARRYIFCATSPSGHPDRALPGAPPFGVRTFLSPCGKRSSGRLQRSLLYSTPDHGTLDHGLLPMDSCPWTLDFRLSRLSTLAFDGATLNSIRRSPAVSRTARASCKDCFAACR